LGFLRIMRPLNSLMVGAATVVGMLIAAGSRLELLELDVSSLGFITGFALSAAAMAINDYYDRGVDLINDPARPIPSGAVKPREAVALAVLLVALGLAASAMLNLACLALAGLAAAVAVSYASAFKAKGLLGNAMVSLCVALPFIYGGLAVGSLDARLLVFASIAFLANMGREVAKGIVDVAGDSAMGVRTVAAVHGRYAAARLASTLFLAAVALSAAPWLMGSVSFYYLPLVAICDVGLIRSSFSLLRSPSREVARRVKGEVLMWMLIGLAAFLSGSLLC
jgi:geranylgeranylglycerol-phosphate geranylgeranyltransferase